LFTYGYSDASVHRSQNTVIRWTGSYHVRMNATPAQLTDFLAGAVEAAKRGAAILESWRSKFSVREKGRADLVTEADVASQKAVREYLLGRFPDHQFLGEEDCVGKTVDSVRPAPGAPPTWVVDPLDGTSNYVHDVPMYCVSIGLQIDAKPAVGVVFDPRLNELFTAAAGQGAFLNGKPMKVSTIGSVRDSMLATGFPANLERHLRNLEVWKRLAGEAQSIRRTGSTALNLAYVAAGRFEGYWGYDNYAWDVMAGSVLITEAGGRVTAADGSAFDPFHADMLGTNGHIHAELNSAIRL
jgi:myo-inositol-1(or 4)-monophosphatase